MKQIDIKDDPNLVVLRSLAEALGDLCDSLVFVGGSISARK
ncbi:MAG: hypothetical protein ACPG4N_00140 [Gammaproteobacteria bacterium]